MSHLSTSLRSCPFSNSNGAWYFKVANALHKTAKVCGFAAAEPYLEDGDTGKDTVVKQKKTLLVEAIFFHIHCLLGKFVAIFFQMYF